MSTKQKIQSDDYYEILEVKKDVSTEDIIKTFKKLAKKWHPDKNTGNTEVATYNMTKILEAKDVLSDPEKREIYDKYGKKGLEESGHHGMDEEQMQDILREMMGGMGGMGGMFHNMQDMFNNGDNDDVPSVKTAVDMTLEELYNGKTVSGTVRRGNLCKTCNGYGSDDGKDHTCDKCDGRGHIIKMNQMGPFMQRSEEMCNKCKGNCYDDKFVKCKACDGTHITFDEYKYECKIPRGAYIKYHTTISQKGNEIPIKDRRNGITRSDLEVYVNELPHETFKHMFTFGSKKVDPADLLIEKEITLAESLCGFQMSILFFNNETIYVSQTNIVKDNDILVVKGKGMPHMDKIGYGDLYIKLSVKYPDEISSNTKTRIWQLLTGQPYVQKDKEHKYIECVSFEQIQQNKEPEYEYNNEGQQQCPVS